MFNCVFYSLNNNFSYSNYSIKVVRYILKIILKAQRTPGNIDLLSLNLRVTCQAFFLFSIYYNSKLYHFWWITYFEFFNKNIQIAHRFQKQLSIAINHKNKSKFDQIGYYLKFSSKYWGGWGKSKSCTLFMEMSISCSHYGKQCRTSSEHCK